MRRIALISCSKSKQNYPCPARELYAPSQLFSLSYQYAKKVADEVYVLSARYGLLAEEDVVAPYDLTLTDLPEHRQQLRQVPKTVKPGLKPVAIAFHCQLQCRRCLPIGCCPTVKLL